MLAALVSKNVHHRCGIQQYYCRNSAPLITIIPRTIVVVFKLVKNTKTVSCNTTVVWCYGMYHAGEMGREKKISRKNYLSAMKKKEKKQLNFRNFVSTNEQPSKRVYGGTGRSLKHATGREHLGVFFFRNIYPVSTRTHALSIDAQRFPRTDNAYTADMGVLSIFVFYF